MNQLKQEECQELQARYVRRGKGIQLIQLLTRTFVSLSLYDREALCDTLNSMISSNLNIDDSYILLADDELGTFSVAGQLGNVSEEELCSPGALAVWDEVSKALVPRAISCEELRKLWPNAPERLARGLAVVPMDVRETVIGLLVVANPRYVDEFTDEDLEVLSSVAGIGAMALSNGTAMAAQRELVRDVERQALEAEQQAAAKQQALADLDQKLEIIERQRSAIQELSTPVLQLWDSVLAMPVIGVVDTRRSADIMERLLSEITTNQSRYVILDITGVEVVDTKTADHFVKVIKAAELLGTSCILTGIRPAVAQTLVEIGVDLSSITTLRNLKEGLKECLRRGRLKKESQAERMKLQAVGG